jgi:hypothetical protein
MCSSTRPWYWYHFTKYAFHPAQITRRICAVLFLGGFSLCLLSHHDRHCPGFHELAEEFTHFLGRVGVVIVDPPGH